jgi:hypothetical protein
MAAPVLSAPEGFRVENEFYARFLAEPLRYLGEDPLQAIGLLSLDPPRRYSRVVAKDSVSV